MTARCPPPDNKSTMATECADECRLVLMKLLTDGKSSTFQQGERRGEEVAKSLIHLGWRGYVGIEPTADF